MFRRGKRLWTVDFGTRGQVVTSDPVVAAALLEYRLAQVGAELERDRSLGELQSRMVSILRARMHAGEALLEEYRDHLRARTAECNTLADVVEAQVDELQRLGRTGLERASWSSH